MRKSAFVFPVIMVLILSQIALADTVYLKDGTIREGSIIEVNDREVKIEIMKGKTTGVITLDRNLVSKIVSSLPDLEELRESGYRLLANESFVDAVAVFERIAELQPASAKARADLGLAALLAGFFEKALESYEKAYALEPNNHELLMSIGFARRKLGRFDEALESYESYSNKNPEASLGYRLSSLVYLEKKMYARALGKARKALKLDENDQETRMLLAEIYWELELYEQAVEEASVAIRISPELGEAYLLRAKIFLSMGRDEQGLQDLDSAVELNPNLAHIAADMASGAVGEKLTEPGKRISTSKKLEEQKKQKSSSEEMVGRSLSEEEPESDTLEEDGKEELREIRKLLEEAIKRLEKLKEERKN